MYASTTNLLSSSKPVKPTALLTINIDESPHSLKIIEISYVQAWVDLYGLSSGCNDGDTKDSKLINPKELKPILDKIGTDPHAFKADYVGKRAVSHYDIYKQNKTGELLLRRKNSSEFIRTGIGCDDDLPSSTAPAKKCSSTQGKKTIC